MPLSAKARVANRVTTIALVLLIFLCLSWELWLAPLRPGGSFLFLKALPLLAPLFGLLHGRRYTHQWTSLLILAYFAEGIVRATTDGGASRMFAAIEVMLATGIFVGSVAFARWTAGART